MTDCTAPSTDSAAPADPPALRAFSMLCGVSLYFVIALPFAALLHGVSHFILRRRHSYGPVLTGSLLGLLIAALLLPFALPIEAREAPPAPPEAPVVLLLESQDGGYRLIRLPQP